MMRSHIAAIVLIAISALNCTEQQQKKGSESENEYTDITTQTFNDQFLKTTADTILLDVRTKAEFDAGHIPGAIHLHVEDPDFITKASAFENSEAIVVYCRTGVRSVTASEMLSGELNFNNVYNLLGGYTQWETGNQSE